MAQKNVFIVSHKNSSNKENDGQLNSNCVERQDEDEIVSVVIVKFIILIVIINQLSSNKLLCVCGYVYLLTSSFFSFLSEFGKQVPFDLFVVGCFHILSLAAQICFTCMNNQIELCLVQTGRCHLVVDHLISWSNCRVSKGGR